MQVYINIYIYICFNGLYIDVIVKFPILIVKYILIDMFIDYYDGNKYNCEFEY